MSYDLYPTINTEGSEEALKKLVKEDKALGKGEKEERNAWLSLVESAMVYPGMSLFLLRLFPFPFLPPSRSSISAARPSDQATINHFSSPRDHLIIV